MDYNDYKNIGDNNHFWYRARKILIKNIFKKIFINKKNNRILEIGCGTCSNFKILKNFGEIEGIDVKKEAINTACNNLYNAKLCNIENCDIGKNKYGAVCCFDVLEHLKNDDLVLKKIYNSLKPNGYFLFTVPAFKIIFSQHDLAMNHYRRYNKKEIIHKLKKNNFKITYLNYWNSFLFPIIFLIRLFKKKLIKKSNIKSEIKNYNKIINKILFFILRAESCLATKKIRAPFGLTIYGIAKKNN